MTFIHAAISMPRQLKDKIEEFPQMHQMVSNGIRGNVIQCVGDDYIVH